MKIIARIKNDFPTKFGVPRQSGIVDSLYSEIVFEPEYRCPEAVIGLEQFSHIWILWSFSETPTHSFSPTVRPPRLGGNTRVGVFATRSPFRPNGIALSSVKLEKIEHTENRGCVLTVSGADMIDGTPIYDIKPYIPYTDCHSDAVGGFAEAVKDYTLDVKCSDTMIEKLPMRLRQGLISILEQDPRPSYHDDAERVYGFRFADYEIKFTVDKNVLNVCDIICCPQTEPNHAQRAMALFREGYNCSQSVIGAFAKELGMDFEQAIKLSSSFGGGMGRLREVCGALSAVFMIAGYKFGYSSPNDREAKKRHYELIQNLAAIFKEDNGSIVCRDILKLGNSPVSATPTERTAEFYATRPCERIIGRAAELVKKMLNDQISAIPK